MNTEEMLLQQMQQMQETINKLADQQTTRETLKGDTIPFIDYMERWLEGDHDWRINTAERYKDLYRLHIKPFFQGVMLSEVDYDMLDAYIRDRKSCLSSGTVQKLKTCLISPALKKAVIRKLIKDNPATLLDTVKVKNKHKRALLDEEIVKLNEVSRPHRLWIAIPLLLYTGMRRSELLGLRWTDIDFKQKTININRDFVSTRTKGNILTDTKTEGSARPVSIPSGLVAMLENYRSTEGKGKTYVISQSKQDKQVDPHNFSRLFRKWCTKADIKGISPHSTRHTYCTMATEEGIDTFTIMRQVGHTTSRMLESVYVHKRTNEMQERGAEKLGAVLDNLMGA